ncbi:MAG: 4Fe-4S dicluster domain-containing protein [Deltaproteobacteria bacterium]|nr:4Fe-4S dicluster domain-containing protein [Deltaproteobacteria bacterium]
MQLGFYFDQTRCTGCDACVIACKDWKDIPAGPVALCRIASLEEGSFPNPSLSFYPLFCFHCAQPPCVDACPTGAISKRAENGVVVVSGDLCLAGCRLCLDACPYRVPQFAEDGPARICDLCLDRWEAGEKPICVVACPQRALDAGPFEEISSRYGGKARVRGFPDPGRTRPSIVFRSKKK